jgi:hypothetical protein
MSFSTPTYPHLNEIILPSAPPAEFASEHVDIKRHNETKFDLLIKQKELNTITASNLMNILTICDVVLLCDDSDSMSSSITEDSLDSLDSLDPFSQKTSTRWLELKKLTSTIIEFVSAIRPDGLDIYFLNRDKILGVTTNYGPQLQSVFNLPPFGSTPLISRLKQIYNEKMYTFDPNSNKKLLMIIITDGDPTDGGRTELHHTLTQITTTGNVHVSFVKCTDNVNDMTYLDQWNGMIRNFDSTDNYHIEEIKVKKTQGQKFKFDHIDYVIKILLGTFIKLYPDLNQIKKQEKQCHKSSDNFYVHGDCHFSKRSQEVQKTNISSQKHGEKTPQYYSQSQSRQKHLYGQTHLHGQSQQTHLHGQSQQTHLHGQSQQTQQTHLHGQHSHCNYQSRYGHVSKKRQDECCCIIL